MGPWLACTDSCPQKGWQGCGNAWPRPGPEAVAIVAAFGAVQAMLQLCLPGAVHKGPVSPKGNVPVYKVLNLLGRRTLHHCV